MLAWSQRKEISRTSSSSLLPAGSAAALAAPDLLTVKEKGAGGDVLGVDPLLTLIPRPLQSDPSEPARPGNSQNNQTDRQRAGRRQSHLQSRSACISWVSEEYLLVAHTGGSKGRRCR
jgi:hypothetical protein